MLDEPFLVLATQNPIEQEGTYPLARSAGRSLHAQAARRYPSRDEEKEIMRRMAGGVPIQVRRGRFTRQPFIDARQRICRVVHGRARRGLHRRHRDCHARPAEAGLKELAPLIEFGA